MVKVTIEIPEELITKRADVDILESARESPENSIVKAIMEFIAFTHLKKAVKEGTTDFSLKLEDFKSDSERKMFENAVEGVTFAVFAKTAGEKKENKETNVEEN